MGQAGQQHVQAPFSNEETVPWPFTEALVFCSPGCFSCKTCPQSCRIMQTGNAQSKEVTTQTVTGRLWLCPAPRPHDDKLSGGMAPWVTSGDEWQGGGWTEPNPVDRPDHVDQNPCWGHQGSAGLCRSESFGRPPLKRWRSFSHVIAYNPKQSPTASVIISPNLQMRKRRLRRMKQPSWTTEFIRGKQRPHLDLSFSAFHCAPFRKADMTSPEAVPQA